MRHVASQSVHDLQIQVAASLYQRQGFHVVTNPGHEKRQSVGGQYPDVLCLFSSGIIARIAEIETEETVTLGHSQQWVSYAGIAAFYGVPFDLWVPPECVEQARRLLVAVRISAFIRPW